MGQGFAFTQNDLTALFFLELKSTARHVVRGFVTNLRDNDNDRGKYQRGIVVCQTERGLRK